MAITIQNFEVADESESFKVSEAVTSLIPEHQVFCFHGDLGSGKTTYIKKIVADLGVEEGTSSPSFSIVNEYITSSGMRIYHFDLYRLRKSIELIDIGWEDYLNSKAPIFIEWPEMALEFIPDDAIHIFISINSSARLITITDNHE